MRIFQLRGAIRKRQTEREKAAKLGNQDVSLALFGGLGTLSVGWGELELVGECLIITYGQQAEQFQPSYDYTILLGTPFDYEVEDEPRYEPSVSSSESNIASTSSSSISVIQASSIANLSISEDLLRLSVDELKSLMGNDADAIRLFNTARKK
uniref:Uncharacterized protein n=1 Tax=Parascaris equorum TaxID=6256 RepID=A0A914RKD5_PAREQ